MNLAQLHTAWWHCPPGRVRLVPRSVETDVQDRDSEMAKSNAQKSAAKPARPAALKAVEAARLTEEGVPAGAGKADKPDQLKKKELVERVVAAVGGKKKAGVKEIVEATLSTLGEALQKGETLNLPPFGKARIAKSKGEGSKAQLTVKLRGAGEKKTARPAKEALAEAGEDG